MVAAMSYTLAISLCVLCVSLKVNIATPYTGVRVMQLNTVLRCFALNY